MAWDRDPHGAEITDVRVTAGVTAAVIVGGMYVAVTAIAPDLSMQTTTLCCFGLAFL